MYQKLLLLLAVLAMVLTACAAPAAQPATAPQVEEPAPTEAVPEGQPAEGEAEPEEAMAGVGVLTYNSYMSDEAPRQWDALNLEAYQALHPDLKIEHSTVAHEDFKQAIRTWLTADEPPDVMTWFAGNRARFFIDKGLIMDIGDLWADQGWNETYPKGFQAMSTVDGKQYFLPWTWYWWGMWYRQSIFDEVGLTPPETWDELLAACDTLNEAGYIPITIGTKFRWTAAAWFDYLNMRINGPEFHINLMLGKEAYDDPRVKAVFEKWNELFEHSCFIDNAAAYSWQEALDFMVQGDAAMYLMGQFILDEAPEDIESDLDFFRFPIIDPEVPIGEDAPTDGFFIAANAPNPEEAKAFLAYLGSAESQTSAAEVMGRIVTNTEVDPAVYDEITQKGIELIQGADFVAQFYDRDTTPEMADEGMNAMMAFWDDPTQIDTLLAQLEEARQRVFAEEQE